MSLFTRMLKQNAVYWPLATSESGEVAYNNDGEIRYGTPIEILCRWEDIAEEFIDKYGTVQVSKSLVYVGIDVSVGGCLYLGDLESSMDWDDPKANEGVWEIRRFDKIPNIRITKFLRIAYL